MKIRTRLLLFLLPILVGSVALFSLLLAYTWRKEIVRVSKSHLQSALTNHTGLTFYTLPPNSPAVASLPPRSHITSIYKTPDGQKKLITAYTPLFDSNGTLLSWSAVDLKLDSKFDKSLFLILLSAILIITIMTSAVYLIAGKISDSVQKLNNSALAIAAGQYNESISATGPKEITDLANTLNTMGECLNENINRLRENSLLRERMYGEYECAMLLQHLMLQKNIDDCRSDAISVKSITLFSDEPRGLLLDFPKPGNPHLFHIHLAEASEKGLEGTYQLLTQYKYSKQSQTHTSVTLDRTASTLQTKGPNSPLIWSLCERQFLSFSETTPVTSGDFFFLFNQGLLKFYKTPDAIAELLTKVLKVFASDGLETTATMLQKELTFATKRKELEEDIHLLCFQLLG